MKLKHIAIAFTLLFGSVGANAVSIPVIVKDSTSPFWQIVLDGGCTAGVELGIEVPLLGPTSEADIADFHKRYEDGISWGYAKKALFGNLNDFLLPFKAEYTKIIQDRSYVESILVDGSKKALEVSTPLIEKVRKSVGIRGF